MKRKILSLLIAIGLFIPTMVSASTEVLDFKDTLASEGIELKYEDYKETDDQVKIYLFRSDGCIHCRDFLNFLNDNAKEIGNKFKLRSFEVSNSDNQKVKEDVISYFSLTAPGTPLIVIGESTFYGFSVASSGEKVLKAINEEYEAKEKFDIIDALEEKKAKKNPNDALYILVPLVLVGVVIVVVNFVKKD